MPLKFEKTIMMMFNDGWSPRVVINIVVLLDISTSSIIFFGAQEMLPRMRFFEGRLNFLQIWKIDCLVGVEQINCITGLLVNLKLSIRVTLLGKSCSIVNLWRNSLPNLVKGLSASV